MSKKLSQIGKHFIVGLSSTVLEKEEKELLKTLNPLGIVIFKRNIANSPNWPHQLQRLINSAKEVTANSDLIISIDHEGGKVHRLREPASHFPAARYWKNDSNAVGQAMGRELKSLGFNLSFAPVLDIFLEPKNTVIGERAFGNSPEEVANWAIEYAKGLEAAGVMSCGKHFPGHGATIADSHFELPQRFVSKEQLTQEELIPFFKYVASGFQLIMTAHVVFPALDKHNPATLSRQIIENLLRQEIGFNGAVITDALEMKALGNTTPTEVAVKALKAGADILLVAIPDQITPLQHAMNMANRIAVAYESFELTTESDLNSQERIAGLVNYIKQIQKKATEIDSSLSIMGCHEHIVLNEMLQNRQKV